MALPTGITFPSTIVNYDYALAVTPSDSTDLTTVSRAIYVGVTGNIAAVLANNDVVTFTAVPVGILPIRCKRINSTNTTATNMVALY